MMHINDFLGEKHTRMKMRCLLQRRGARGTGVGVKEEEQIEEEACKNSSNEQVKLQ